MKSNVDEEWYPGAIKTDYGKKLLQTKLAENKVIFLHTHEKGELKDNTCHPDCSVVTEK